MKRTDKQPIVPRAIAAAGLPVLLLMLLAFRGGEGDVSGRERVFDDEVLIKFRAKNELTARRTPETLDRGEYLSWLNSRADIEFAEPDFSYRASIIPSDSYYNSQWYLKKINAAAGWNYQNGSPRIVIAVIDSGVQIDHPDLSENIWTNRREIPGNGVDDDGNGFIDDYRGWDFVAKNNDPNPKFENDWTLDGATHGTLVAGIIAAAGNNAAGTAGITWRAQLMPLRVLDGQGQGRANDVIKAIDYAVANGADIINLSFNGFNYSQGMNEAIKRAYEAGVIVVAAAGNELAGGSGVFLDKKPMYPVCNDGSRGENWVIGVAATDALDQKTSFSAYGFNCIDLAAPGVGIFSTSFYAPGRRYQGKSMDKYYDGYWSGTSVAVPQVSGALALLLAADPEANRQKIIRLLLDNTENISRLNPNYLGQLGRGRLNLEASLEKAADDFNSRKVKLLMTAAGGKADILKIANFSGKEELRFAAADKRAAWLRPAAGDVNGDGLAEILVGQGAAADPAVRIYSQSSTTLRQFLAYDKNFRGGVNVAAGDVNGDGLAEIIVAPASGGGPQVRIYDSRGRLLNQFFAYDKGFRGGLELAAVDLDNKITGQAAEIIVGLGTGAPPQVRVFDYRGALRTQFLAFDRKFTGGVKVAAGDLNRDGLVEIIAGAGPGGSPHVKIFDAGGKLMSSFYGFEEQFRGGVNLATLIAQ